MDKFDEMLAGYFSGMDAIVIAALLRRVHNEALEAAALTVLGESTSRRLMRGRIVSLKAQAPTPREE